MKFIAITSEKNFVTVEANDLPHAIREAKSRFPFMTFTEFGEDNADNRYNATVSGTLYPEKSENTLLSVSIK